MFTGIVEELGVVLAVEPRTDAATLTIGCGKVLDDVTHGASIAVNGVCLTVTSFSGQSSDRLSGRSSGRASAEVPEITDVSEPPEPPEPPGSAGGGGATPSFTVDVMKETLDRTSLGGLAAGDQVNLERPVRLMDRLGGHLVQGHVDGVGTLVERHRGQHWDTVRISLPPGLDRYLVEKGSVAVDGVSLTVVDVTPAATRASAATGTSAGPVAPAARGTSPAMRGSAAPAAPGATGTSPAMRASAARGTATATATATAAAVGTPAVDDTPASFTVGLIPTTLASTTLGRRAVGDQVNIEVDVLSKYVEKLSAQTPTMNGVSR